MKKTPIDKTIDIQDIVAPLTLLKVEATLSTMKSGQVLEVLCGDRETKEDLLNIVNNSGRECLAVSRLSDAYQIVIRKGADKKESPF